MSESTPDSIIINSQMLKTVPGRYDLTLLAAARAHAIERGSPPRISEEAAGKHKPTVIALLEIEAGLIGMDYYNDQKATEQRWKAEREQMDGAEVEQEDSNFFPRSSKDTIQG